MCGQWRCGNTQYHAVSCNAMQSSSELADVICYRRINPTPRSGDQEQDAVLVGDVSGEEEAKR